MKPALAKLTAAQLAPDYSASQPDYHRRELATYYQTATRAAVAPRGDQQSAGRDFASLLRDTGRLARNTDWLLVGDYGYGPGYLAAQAVAGRGNAPAALGQMLAVLDCQCPPRQARAVWRQMAPAEQAAATAAIQSAIDAHIATCRQELALAPA